ncbi:trehalose-phosphatase [Sphingomonas quercus]|uniref:Trehalose 6-phosphate phosphatase n=1 Tax=Sphingomonas quercus TaxID=2842451 RepID=A0ABS6BMA0_9SPHN|nr:trehalose-phosphatase [Sphingomonas quercus]MBU3079440.1 trehalose-phosphatase [Sphingomonas quercus]
MSLSPPPTDLPDRLSLFLDFDGTLVEMAPRPDAVAVDAGLQTLMGTLSARLDGRLAVVSGRSVARIRQFFGIAGFAIGGSHGVEMAWPDGRNVAPGEPRWRQRVIAQVTPFAESHPGVLVEVKPFGVALHYRLAPEAGPAVHALADELAAADGLRLQHGKMMVELREAGADKGDAVRAFMAEPAMAAGVPFFLGDDLTDESAFAAVAELGGAGVLVGPERRTAARYRLPDVAAVHGWLEALAGVAA